MGIDDINQELAHAQWESDKNKDKVQNELQMAKWESEGKLVPSYATELSPKLQQLATEIGYKTKKEVLQLTKEDIIQQSFEYADKQIKLIRSETDSANGQLQRASVERGMTKEKRIKQEKEMRKQIIIERIDAVLELQAILKGEFSSNIEGLEDSDIDDMLGNFTEIEKKLAS